MGWKKVWERYQMAATFAEAGEHRTARQFLREGSEEETAKAEDDRGVSGEKRGGGVHGAWKTRSAHGLGS